MDNREKSQRRDVTGSRSKTQQNKKPDTVGTGMPDESKERHTEIAVEAGNKGREEMEKR